MSQSQPFVEPIMPFMQQEILETPFYLVETDIGTEVVPAYFVGACSSKDGVDDVSELQEYCEGEIVEGEELELRTGFIHRMSAPGFLDSTSWGWAETEEEAREALTEMYGED